jgi:hypothetical protein
MLRQGARLIRERLKRRWIPLAGSVIFIVIGMFTTTWGPTHLMGRTEWALPYDLWGTLIAAVRLAHGNVGGIYGPGTGLISLPGAAVILVPVAVVISAFGLSLQIPGADNLHPAVWLVAGPYQMAISCVALFAADALAERLGVGRWKRALLCAASLGILWSPSPRWGHPEDTVALGLLLYAVLAQSKGKLGLAGWLTGCAICVQPLVLLAVPVQLALLPWRRMIPFLVRGAVPSAVLLAAAAIGNWHDTYQAVTSQPDSPVINHPTLWTSLAPQMAGQNVAAGPFRLATIVLACLCAVLIRRRWQALAAADQPWSAALLADVLWWVALTLALRSFFEPVMVSYYPWPPMAVALIPAAYLGWRRLWVTALIAGGLTAAAQGPSHSTWIWWAPIVAGLVIMLAVARPRRTAGLSPAGEALTPSEAHS